MNRLLSCLLLLAYCAPAAAPQPVRGSKVMVTSVSGIASEVGAGILKKGGNAVDAAVAVAFALAVTHPAAGNIGGGGFMVIRMADGRAAAIDYREMAPAKAHKAIFLDDKGNVIPGASKTGHKAVGVPGTVAGMAMARERFGKLGWAELVAPAQRLARDGFPVSYAMARSLRSLKPKADSFSDTVRVFLKDGAFYQEGEILKQPDLAATLERIAKQGPREFYEGRTADLLEQEMSAHGGLITKADLSNYKPVLREPVRGSYRGYQLLSMPPVSSGGLLLMQMLAMLERYDLASLGFNSSAKNHLLIETMKRCYADRAAYVGDPAFVNVPISSLLNPGYVARRAATISLDRATPSNEIREGAFSTRESNDTTHFSVVDAEGNAVSNTYTLRDGYGSGITVTGAGFLLNNVMDEFAAKAGAPNAFGFPAGEVNTIAPGKRPVSSQTPTIAIKDGKLAFVVGSPGGTTIPNTVLQVVINLIDHRMNIQEAIDAPRIHHQWLPDLVKYEPNGLVKDVVHALEAKGQHLQPEKEVGAIGIVHGIAIEANTGVRLGASDSRSADGRAVGW
jgi:gamma-glutamyltranspeptidase/glutathione hydrolase